MLFVEHLFSALVGHLKSNPDRRCRQNFFPELFYSLLGHLRVYQD